MQLNRHKILEIILLKEIRYNKRCLPVESSYEAIWFVYMSMYIYGTNIDRMPGSAPLDGVSFLCCWRESHCHPKTRETAYACKHLLPNYLAGSNVQRYLFTFTDFNMMEWNVFNISYIQLAYKIISTFLWKDCFRKYTTCISDNTISPF